MSYKEGAIKKISSDMEKKGASEGSALRPASDAPSPDLNETKVMHLAADLINDQLAKRANSFVDIDKKLNETSQKINDLEAASNSLVDDQLVKGAFHSELSKYEHDLINTCSKELETRAALNGFKVKNGIQESAHYPDDLLFHFSLLILAVALETAFNAFFYQGANGLLGGAVVAFGVSMVNMSVAAICGAFARYINIEDSAEKIKGYASIIIFAILAIVLNLIFSTFRVQYDLLQNEVVNQGLVEPTTEMLVKAFKVAVLDAFGVFLFHFPTIDFMSLILFFVGLFCSFMAFWKGYTHDDKHPGYGKCDRLHNAARSTYQNFKSDALKAATKKIEEIVSEIEDIRKNIISIHRSMHAIKAELQGIQSKTEACILNIQGELNLVINSYRGANKATRATPPPKYFDYLPQIEYTKDNSAYDLLLTKAEEITEAARKISDERIGVLDQKLHLIKGELNTLIQSEFQRFINEITEKTNESLKKHKLEMSNEY